MANPAVVSTALVLTLAAPLAASNQSDLSYFFEGRSVTVQIDMPATKDGVNVYANGRRSLDVGQYRDDLRRFGTAIRAGESAVVTLVKVKDDLVEFQLGGGGFGTFFDDTSTSVYIPTVSKSQRERDLERRLRDEDDRGRRRQIERELNDLRNYRERENWRITLERERLSEMKRSRVAYQRVNGGSRFNVRFNGRVPYDLRPEDIMDALGEFVRFR